MISYEQKGLNIFALTSEVTFDFILFEILTEELSTIDSCK